MGRRPRIVRSTWATARAHVPFAAASLYVALCVPYAEPSRAEAQGPSPGGVPASAPEGGLFAIPPPISEEASSSAPPSPDDILGALERTQPRPARDWRAQAAPAPGEQGVPAIPSPAQPAPRSGSDSRAGKAAPRSVRPAGPAQRDSQATKPTGVDGTEGGTHQGSAVPSGPRGGNPPRRQRRSPEGNTGASSGTGSRGVSPQGAPPVSASSNETGADAETSPSPSEGAPKKPAWFFPDWPAPAFDWSLHPVMGFQYLDNSRARTRSSTLEGGLQARMWGIPLKEGNPGASLAPHAGYALGFVTAKPTGGQTETGFYHRVWGGIETPVIVKFTRTTLGVRYGQINGKIVPPSKMGALDLDEGILVLPFFSTHYTYGYVRLFEREWAQRALESNDHWVSLRFFTSFLNSQIAFGPGVTFAKYYVPEVTSRAGKSDSEGSTTLYADTRTDSLRGLAGSDLFWKLRASADARYVINVQRKQGGAIESDAGGARLPDQSLGDAPDLPLHPKDTLLASAFLGIKGLVGGLGFGYRYTLEIRDLNERNGRKRSRREDSGAGLFYEAKL